MPIYKTPIQWLMVLWLSVESFSALTLSSRFHELSQILKYNRSVKSLYCDSNASTWLLFLCIVKASDTRVQQPRIPNPTRILLLWLNIILFGNYFLVNYFYTLHNLFKSAIKSWCICWNLICEISNVNQFWLRMYFYSVHDL